MMSKKFLAKRLVEENTNRGVLFLTNTRNGGAGTFVDWLVPISVIIKFLKSIFPYQHFELMVGWIALEIKNQYLPIRV